MHEIFQIEQEGTGPKLLRKKLKTLVEEVEQVELTRVIRILEALVH